VTTCGLTGTACSRFVVRPAANAAPSKPPTHDHVARDSAPNELQHASLSGKAPTLKPVSLQGRHCSSPVSTRRRMTEPYRDVATKLPMDVNAISIYAIMTVPQLHLVVTLFSSDK